MSGIVMICMISTFHTSLIRYCFLLQGGYKDYISVDDEVIELCEKIIGLVRENSEECLVCH